jgi:hypothetical protein
MSCRRGRGERLAVERVVFVANRHASLFTPMSCLCSLGYTEGIDPNGTLATPMAGPELRMRDAAWITAALHPKA